MKVVAAISLLILGAGCSGIPPSVTVQGFGYGITIGATNAITSRHKINETPPGRRAASVSALPEPGTANPKTRAETSKD